MKILENSFARVQKTVILCMYTIWAMCISSCKKDEEACKDNETWITMTTVVAKAVEIRVLGSGTATIDWGDGTESQTYSLVPYNNDDFPNFQLGRIVYYYRYDNSEVLEHNIRIYGENITHFILGGEPPLGELPITSLEVINNSGLIFLDCSYSQLTTGLDVTKAVDIKTLICTSSQITNLDVTKNIALEVLVCDWGQLLSLDVSNNINLVELGCSYNQLTNLDVKNSTALKILGCSNNQLTSLDLINNTALERLYSFCTNMYKRGLPTLMIMSISGHKTEGAFLKYIKIKQDEHAEMMKKAWEGIYK